jgi:hypothetical protein
MRPTVPSFLSLWLLVLFAVTVNATEGRSHSLGTPAREEDLHQDITNPEVRSEWISKFDSVKRQHIRKESHDSSGTGKKAAKKLTPQQKAEMIAKMKVSSFNFGQTHFCDSHVTDGNV